MDGHRGMLGAVVVLHVVLESVYVREHVQILNRVKVAWTVMEEIQKKSCVLCLTLVKV